MTNWDLMTEYIHNAMRVVDRARVASRKLRENANPETFDNFRAQMDELTDRLSKTLTGKPFEYRRTPRMHLDRPASKER